MKIKNCPFCGSKVELRKIPLWSICSPRGYPGCYEYVISCNNCGCNKYLGNNNTVYNTDEEAEQNTIDNWNMRAYKEEEKEFSTCGDTVSREAIIAKAKDEAEGMDEPFKSNFAVLVEWLLEKLTPVTPKQRLCKDCKFFEYDSVANVDGVPLIMAHEICNKWGDGCKTSEDGYCFLFEPKEGEKKNDQNEKEEIT